MKKLIFYFSGFSKLNVFILIYQQYLYVQCCLMELNVIQLWCFKYQENWKKHLSFNKTIIIIVGYEHIFGKKTDFY